MEYRLIVNSKFKRSLTKLHRLAKNMGLECSLENVGKKQPTIVNGFYLIDRTRILDATTPKYRKFLKEAGYGDLDSCSRIEIAEDMLKIDQKVRRAAARASIDLNGNDGDGIVNINYPNARKLVEALGCKLPTTALMYKLFIPYLKYHTKKGNTKVQETLNEMIKLKAEWLEDIIIDKNKVRIGTKEEQLSLSADGGVDFEKEDINEFGYPDAVKDQVGEFSYFGPNATKNAVVRDRGAGLDLSLDGSPSGVDGGLGVRCAKIFYGE